MAADLDTDGDWTRFFLQDNPSIDASQGDLQVDLGIEGWHHRSGAIVDRKAYCMSPVYSVACFVRMNGRPMVLVTAKRYWKIVKRGGDSRWVAEPRKSTTDVQWFSTVAVDHTQWTEYLNVFLKARTQLFESGDKLPSPK
jgi:hypothetical protein